MLAEGQERNQLELDIVIALSSALMGVKGYTDPEVITTWERAHRLVTETAGAGTPQHFSVLYGAWAFHMVSGHAEIARSKASDFLSLAQSGTASGPLVVGHRLLANMMMFCGDYRGAHRHLDIAASLYRPEEHREFMLRYYSHDSGISALLYLSWALWHRGYPNQSATPADRALEFSRQYGQAFTLAYALWHIAAKAVLLRQVDEAGACANECVTMADEHDLPVWAANGRIVQGWAAAHNSNTATGISLIREGLARAEATGSHNCYPFFMALLTEALALEGKTDEGLVIIDDGLSRSATSGEKGWDAELYRLRGELLRLSSRPDPARAEAAFQTALAVARKQGTRGYALRAATSLARLWCELGRVAEARNLLAPVYGWFTEGFGTPDLKEAKALLDELA